MTDMVVDNKMVWTKNAEYWDAENVHLDTINWYIVAQSLPQLPCLRMVS